MNKIYYARVTPEDVHALREIALLTFTDTFGPYNTAGDMEKYLQEEMTTDKFSGEIEDPACQIFFAVTGGKRVGYITLFDHDDPAESPAQRGLKIERLYIVKEFQGKKYGQGLLDFAVEISRGKKADYLWLGVWERNFGAIAFYERNGFVRTGSCLFMLGNDRQTDYIMKKYLRV